MTEGEGGPERVAHINSPPAASVPRLKHTSLHMSDDYIRHLSTIPLVLVYNFPFVLTLTKERTCFGYRSRKICQTIAFGFLSPKRSH